MLTSDNTEQKTVVRPLAIDILGSAELIPLVKKSFSHFEYSGLEQEVKKIIVVFPLDGKELKRILQAKYKFKPKFIVILTDKQKLTPINYKSAQEEIICLTVDEARLIISTLIIDTFNYLNHADNQVIFAQKLNAEIYYHALIIYADALISMQKKSNFKKELKLMDEEILALFDYNSTVSNLGLFKVNKQAINEWELDQAFSHLVKIFKVT